VIIKKTFSIVLAVLFIVSPFSLLSYATSATKLEDSEKKRLSFFDNKLCENEQIIKLKELGLLNEFIDYLYANYSKHKEENNIDAVLMLNNWDLSLDTTTGTLKRKAQKYVEKNFNFSIDSTEFKEFMINYFRDEANGGYSYALNNKDFGALYLYMCLAYELEINSNYAVELTSQCSLEKWSLEKLFNFDYEYNFKETQIPMLLYQYIENNAKSISSAWPDLNGTNIMNYARTYALSYNPYYFYISNDDGGDCTNFASQALYNGGLPMTYITSDTTSNGYVNTQARWFCFPNSTSFGYGVSTSWVRVKELYNYLSPHYAVYEARTNTNVVAYLNDGFLLQGKRPLGSYSHSVIVYNYNGSMKYSAHSTNRLDENISTFLNYYYKCRLVQVY